MGFTAAVLLALSLMSNPIGGKPARSACNKETQGRYWPDKANTDRRLAGQLMRSGDLQICARGMFRYNWEPLTVSYQALVEKKKR
jgi:hypothetical protein